MTEENCSICYTVLSEKEQKKLPCNHIFHLDCIQGWYNTRAPNSNTCPLCRAIFLFEKEVLEIILKEHEIPISYYSTYLIINMRKSFDEPQFNLAKKILTKLGPTYNRIVFLEDKPCFVDEIKWGGIQHIHSIKKFEELFTHVRKINQRGRSDSKFVMIFDEINWDMFLRSDQNKRLFQDLIYNHRFINVNIIILNNDAPVFPPTIRTYIDNIVLMGNGSSRYSVYRQYVQGLMSLQNFAELLDNDNYLVLNNSSYTQEYLPKITEDIPLITDNLMQMYNKFFSCDNLVV